MREQMELLDIDLKLFDGGEGSGTAGGEQGGPDAGGQKGEEAGKTAAGKSSDAGSERSARIGTPLGMDRSEGERRAAGRPGDQPESEGSHSEQRAQSERDRPETPEARRARYKAMVEGEFKDLYTADTQRIIDKRFKETRGLQEALEAHQPILDRMMRRYGARDLAELGRAVETDEAMVQTAADRAGLSVEQYLAEERRDMERLRKDRELSKVTEQLNAIKRRQFADQQEQQWRREAEETKKVYPAFDFEADLADREFCAMLRCGTPVKVAYERLHREELEAEAVARAVAERERALIADIQARGARPAENGASAQNAVTAATDVSKMTREEREALAQRALRGEKNITLR